MFLSERYSFPCSFRLLWFKVNIASEDFTVIGGVVTVTFRLLGIFGQKYHLLHDERATKHAVAFTVVKVFDSHLAFEFLDVFRCHTRILPHSINPGRGFVF